MHDDTVSIRYGDAAQEDHLTARVEAYGLTGHVDLEHDPDYEGVTLVRSSEHPAEFPELEDYFERMRRQLEKARDPFRWPPDIRC